MKPRIVFRLKGSPVAKSGLLVESFVHYLYWVAEFEYALDSTEKVTEVLFINNLELTNNHVAPESASKECEYTSSIVVELFIRKILLLGI